MSETARRFAGRTALVTGGSRGIGAGVASRLAAEGARVIVTGRDLTRIRSIVNAIERSGGTALGVPAELTEEADVITLREQAERAFGPVTLLVCCAGGGGEPKPFIEESLERWRETLETNLTSAFLCLRTFLPPMLERRNGSIVMMGSSAGRQLSGASTPYAAAKAGLFSLARQAAFEAAPYGVRINLIAPSAIITDRLAMVPVEQRERIASAFPLLRLGEVEDVIEPTLFLLSEAAGWITGSTLDVAGGRVML
jgi:3-oxoacyl-[acyl-carrier protein] reductase